MTIDSPTDLSLLAAAVNDKIAALDATTQRLASERDRLGLGDPEDAAIAVVVRTAYARLARRLEQALDVPFMDQDEAVRVLFAEGSIVVGVRG